MSEQQLGALAAALAQAQSEFQPIVKDLEVSFNSTKYKYADLAAVIDATKAALAKHGLAVTQCAEYQGERLLMHTRLIHKDGGCISSFWPLPAQGKPQDMGSALTYARRYSLSAILNVASEADDDGQAGQNTGGKAPASPKAETAAKKAAEQQKPTDTKAPTGIFLDLGGGNGSHHASVSAYLDALEKALKEADDAGPLFDLNSVTLQKIQAKALAKNEGATVGRITAIFDHIHAGTVPGLAA